MSLKVAYGTGNMTQIFISYSSHDQDFALRVVADLEHYFQVWIDESQLKGGLEWEQSIDEALHKCLVFIVIVSPHSNDSQWVARETIRAEQLNKYRVPVLIDGQLPLRLLNLQYVDFQGSYEGGFRDLLEVLKKQLEPEDRRQGDANRLIGEGIRACLNNDLPTANSLIGQALILDPQLATSVDAFWMAVRREQTTDWATRFLPQISIGEWAGRLHENIYSEQAGKNVDYYRWSVEIVADEDILDKIDYVQYELHETFAEPIQIVRARKTNFRLRGAGWGTFPVKIAVYFQDGTIGSGVYELQFDNRTVPLTQN
jgi:hypothetical protein